MCLTIGLFREHLSGRDTAEHVRQLSQSLAWRVRCGWVEWNSPCYQAFYLNPLLILARHAPSEGLRRLAENLVNLQLAERALLSVNGYLGGPFYRGYEQHIVDDRRDSFLPIVWICFGLSGAAAHDGLDAAFAADAFEPHPVVSALAADAPSRAVLYYRGTRTQGHFPPTGHDGKHMICYFNTPHVSMGSMRSCGYSFQTRFFNVLFAAEPSKHLRTHLRDAVVHTPWDERNERGEVAQHRNWLVARGKLVAEGGLTPMNAGGWDVYQVGKGLCAHRELPDGWHVFQAGDLDMHAGARAFIAALREPRKLDGRIEGLTTEGRLVSVSLADMSLAVDGELQDWTGMLHDCPFMRSVYGSGRVDIASSAGTLAVTDRCT